MVAIAAFLVILVILFGIEGTRALIFGAFGVFFWVVGGLVLLGLIIMAFDSFKKSGDGKKGTSDSVGGWILFIVFASIIGIAIFNTATKGEEPKKDSYSILKSYNNGSSDYTFEGLEFESLESCKVKMTELNYNRPDFRELYPDMNEFARLAKSYAYYCGKNCDHTSPEPKKKCEEIVY